MPGRILAIGDIHGCHVALDVLLANVGPTGDDTVVVLGDVMGHGVEATADMAMTLLLAAGRRTGLLGRSD